MKNLWEEQDSSVLNAELAQRVSTAQKIGEQGTLVLPGSGSVSVKISVHTLLGEEKQVLCISPAGGDLKALESEDFTLLGAEPLAGLVRLESIPDALLENELLCARIHASAPPPPAQALLHAVLPYRYVDFTQPAALFAIASAPQGQSRLDDIFQGEILVLPYAPTGLPLARACSAALQSTSQADIRAIWVMNQGLVTFGDSAEAAYDRLLACVNRAEQYLQEHEAWEAPDLSVPAPEQPLRKELAGLRKAVSEAAGVPMIVSLHEDPKCRGFTRQDNLAGLARQAPFQPPDLVTSRPPLVGRDVRAYSQAIGESEAKSTTGSVQSLPDTAPRIILDPDWGLLSAGRTVEECDRLAQHYCQAVDIILRATALGGYSPFTGEEPVEAESGRFPALQAGRDAGRLFSGEVALVTGAASGIGKACAESLLSRGAAVVALDISPKIVGLFDTNSYLGIVCDLTDEDAIRQALEETVRRFGGLDMLILNAGIFPSGCRIESLGLDLWHKVYRLNVDANLCMLREAYPLLRDAPRNGRVVIIGTRNVKTPGPGVAPYSSSKAALTQLARVAALEWGKDRIRVNMIHPDSVFDTALFTEEVLKNRAASYGMTVEQYKTNNLLGLELTSRDVGELAAEMCGPLFAKTTGAQVNAGSKDTMV